MNFIITGLGYGDEGKGVVTNYYAKTRPNSIVVRYGGGHQVGHTVMEDELHEFHHFGSGTMVGVPTFYSRFCTVEPDGFIKEYKELEKYKPKVIYDPRVMITTPYDVNANRNAHRENGHGTVGLGFGATVERNERNYHLYVSDIECKFVFMNKLMKIRDYYGAEDIDFEYFYEICRSFADLTEVSINPTSQYRNIIFEGHQGVLLDKEWGIFPHVTRSKTTCYNALQLIKEFNNSDETALIGVTRAYSTRHGNGPFREAPITLKNNQWETNKDNEWQGKFKKSPLQLDLLKYSYGRHLLDFNKFSNINELVVTCLDQVENPNEVIDQVKTVTPNIRTNSSPKSQLLYA